MTNVQITHAETCAPEGDMIVTLTISNEQFTEPVQSIDLYGTLGIGAQPPLSGAGAWPKTIHQIVPTGTYTAGAQFHFADGPTRATEISITVDTSSCTPATTVPEISTPVSLEVTTTTAPPATVLIESHPKVEPAPPPSVTGSTTIAISGSLIKADTLPVTGPGRMVAAELGLALVLVALGVGIARYARRVAR